MSWSLIISIISIIFYFIVCKGLVYGDDFEGKRPFTLLHFLLLSIISLIPLLNIIELCLAVIILVMAAFNDCIHIKNSNSKLIKFLNKEL